MKEIPQKVMDEVILQLKNYLIALYTVLREKDQTRAHPIGSGTFVELNGMHYILTAAHVWQEVRKEKEIGLVLPTINHPSKYCEMALWLRSCGMETFPRNGGLIWLS